IESHWQVDGTHYQRTAEDWLGNMDRHRDELLPVLAQAYGEADVRRWWVYWRVFFMACAELFGYRGGREWIVSHYGTQFDPEVVEAFVAREADFIRVSNAKLQEAGFDASDSRDPSTAAPEPAAQASI
ncbi:MAG TPA: hypothetical protein PJ982_14675, partial [Lacipirellulaceae bacterium]|nr:hypothetical protein [Lacipirellulaceae bacterium]